MQKKICPRHNSGAGKLLPISAFYRDRSRKGGLALYCRECMKANRRDSYARLGQTLQGRFSGLRYRAASRGIGFELSFDDFLEFIASPCIYGGGKPSDFAIEIDRKDATKPYTKENCAPSCPRHNLIKGKFFSFDSMLRIVREFPEAANCGDVRTKATLFNPRDAHIPKRRRAKAEST